MYPKHAVNTVMKYAQVDEDTANILLDLFPQNFEYSNASAAEWRRESVYAKQTYNQMMRDSKAVVDQFLEMLGGDESRRDYAENLAKESYPWAFKKGE